MALNVLVVCDDTDLRNLGTSLIHRAFNEAGFQNVALNPTNEQADICHEPAELPSVLDHFRQTIPSLFEKQVTINYGDLGLVPTDTYQNAFEADDEAPGEATVLVADAVEDPA